MAVPTKRHFTVAKKLPTLELPPRQHLLVHLPRMDTISTLALPLHVSAAHTAMTTRTGSSNTPHLRYCRELTFHVLCTFLQACVLSFYSELSHKLNIDILEYYTCRFVKRIRRVLCLFIFNSSPFA
jgi:hypothetical protein